MKDGFITVASAIPPVRVADVEYNVKQICLMVADADAQGAEIIVFPELSLTGYTCQDLFTQQLLLDKTELGIEHILEFTRNMDIISIVGAPIEIGNLLLNCALVLWHGEIRGIITKTYLPNYGEFYEKRWFASSQDFNGAHIDYAGTRGIEILPDTLLFTTSDGVRFGIELCEDVWAPVPPSNHLALAGADLIFNLSASDDIIGKHQYLKSLIAQQSARTISGYIYASCGYGESTQDVVYGGTALIYENGALLAEAERFSLHPQLIINEIDILRLRSERRRNTTFINAQCGEQAPIVQLGAPRSIKKERTGLLTYRHIAPHPFIPSDADMHDTCEEILSIQSMGLVKRLEHTHAKCAVIGISGGLDSTLALLVCVHAFDKLKISREGIVGVTMPGFGTTGRTHANALTLMQALGVSSREIPIGPSVTQHFHDIGHDSQIHDVTYENSQARERTQILMDLSNQLGGLVVGTGDLSELALGWATYNGDHMSMYGVNAGVPKTLVQYLVRHVAQETTNTIVHGTLLDILSTPISPELTPADDKGNIAQKTEDLVGPYELHDFFLYYMLRFGFSPKRIYLLARHAFNTDTYSDATIKKWLRTFVYRFFTQQFKRSCLPDGPKVGSVSLSPRGDWRMPTDASANEWLKECENL